MMDTVETSKSRFVSEEISLWLLVVVFCVIGFYSAMEKRAELNEKHEHIIATTTDVSNGDNLVRVRHDVQYASNGECVQVIQEYKRSHARYSFEEPPEVTFLPCSKEYR